MFSILDFRLWGVFILVLGLSTGAGYFKGRSDGRVLERSDAAAAVEKANIEVRKINELRQDRVDEVARLAAANQRRILADAASARSELDGLRDDNAALRAAAQSFAAADEAFRVTSGLLESCSRLYLSVSEDAARADAEARELRASWPK